MNTSLVRYDAACHALAEARSVDEVKQIHDKAVAVQAYARQANDKQLEADAYEIRKRAEDRAGYLLKEMAARGERDIGKGGDRKSRSHDVTVIPPRLSDLGITKMQSHRWQQFSELPTAEKERVIKEGREEVIKSIERSVMAKVRRREKHKDIAENAKLTVAPLGPFPLIYADPPWKWGHFGEQDQENEAGKARTPDQHYPTLTYDEIKDFRVGEKLVSEIAHKDAALLMWCTSANIELALQVMQAWGFTYKAHAVWVKDRSGTGLIFRNRHEPLLYGTRGKMPGPQYQPQSVFEYPRGKHSAKPPEIRTEIEKMYPDFDARTRIELFARESIPGWTVYGNQVHQNAAA